MWRFCCHWTIDLWVWVHVWILGVCMQMTWNRKQNGKQSYDDYGMSGLKWWMCFFQIKNVVLGGFSALFFNVTKHKYTKRTAKWRKFMFYFLKNIDKSPNCQHFIESILVWSLYILLLSVLVNVYFKAMLVISKQIIFVGDYVYCKAVLVGFVC